MSLSVLLPAMGAGGLLPPFVLSLLLAMTDAAVHIPSKEIAPGVQMPVVSIGTGGQERQAAATIVGNWLALGGRGIDTALMYGNQDVVGNAIEDSGIDRRELFVTSKIPGCENAAADVATDLQQLGLEYIDLMLIHFPTRSCPEAWRVLEDLHAKGVLRAIGVSNFRPPNLEELLQEAKVVPAINQIQHNVIEHDDETLAFSEAHHIAIEAFSPLGRANQSGDISGNKVIQAVAANHNVSTYQVALRWIVQHQHLLTFQSHSQPHQEQDANIFEFSLTTEEMSKLDQLQARSKGPAASPSLQQLVV